jgi:hypothetical protein
MLLAADLDVLNLVQMPMLEPLHPLHPLFTDIGSKNIGPNRFHQKRTVS